MKKQLILLSLLLCSFIYSSAAFCANQNEHPRQKNKLEKLQERAIRNSLIKRPSRAKKKSVSQQKPINPTTNDLIHQKGA